MTQNEALMTQNDAVDALRALCRGEISAVETYNQALQSESLARFRPQLSDCQRSHQARVFELLRRIRALGGWPPESSGAWGLFARMVEGAATTFGEKAAIAILEEGEAHGLNEYQTRLCSVDAESRTLIQRSLLPAQVETHGLARLLRQRTRGEA